MNLKDAKPREIYNGRGRKWANDDVYVSHLAYKDEIISPYGAIIVYDTEKVQDIVKFARESKNANPASKFPKSIRDLVLRAKRSGATFFVRRAADGKIFDLVNYCSKSQKHVAIPAAIFEEFYKRDFLVNEMA
jgi:hypothetical protein